MLVLPEQDEIHNKPVTLTPEYGWIGRCPIDVLGLEPPTGQLSKQASKVCVTAGGWRVHLGCLAMVKV